MKKEWTISFAVTGYGTATVEAETEEEAIEKFNRSQFKEEPKIEEWDVNGASHRGGYVEANVY